MKLLKVGVIGQGKIGERHLNAYSNIKDVEVEWLCDENLEAIEKYSSRYEITDDFETVLDSDVDIIDVCVPTYLHHDIVLRSLDRDKHVFCEKPLTHKVEYAKRIEEKARESKGMLMVGYLYRFHPSFLLLKDVLNKGVIGDPYYAIFRIGGRGGHRAWKHKAETGGGAMLDMLTHMLDLAIYYLGDPVEVYPFFSSTVLEERQINGEKVKADAEDLTSIGIKTEKGTQALFISDLITPSYMNMVEVHGDNGSFVGSILSKFPSIVYCKEQRDIYDLGENMFTYQPVNLIERELSYFVDCILNSNNDTSYTDTSIKTLEVIEEVRNNGHINGKSRIFA